MRSKHLSQVALALRKECHNFYQSNITSEVVENLLNFLLQSLFTKGSSGLINLEETSLLDKGQEKELSIDECVVWLLQGIMERFSELT